MAQEPSWDDIFRPSGTPAPAAPRAVAPEAPTPDSAVGSRRAAREAGSHGGGRGPRRKRNLWWLWVLIALLAIGIGGAATVWVLYEDKVREVLGWELPNDYEGSGNGVEVTIVIQSGDIGSDVARTLNEAGVTMTFDAFYDLLLTRPDVSFEPGNFLLQEQMSASSALDALLDPANKITNTVTIPEGTSYEDALALIGSATGISVDELMAAASDPTVYGVPAEAPNLEGWLFPATYPLDPGVTAEEVIQRLVDEMMTRLDGFGVEPEDRLEVLIKASIVQREAGSNIDDFYKVARVFQNRLDQGWRLESDATVAYGTGNTHTVWTTGEERADASNLYNTYANDGLPIGPIGLPGEAAIESVLNPAEGDWMFFVPINLKTGETVFSETVAQHEAAVAQLQAWCRASTENASYCA
ncbi:endolytic transglycosylase MltG [uncultured Schumannella sp.]|uniref:endolytic transglycosylase MltG n=1 Tax=uncultured Schumannella sp. TaxID=1195956 RepID=UPI0025D068FE|nr:endolytic transglycosylase MltG [uncultured Schumannella sp.]